MEGIVGEVRARRNYEHIRSLSWARRVYMYWLWDLHIKGDASLRSSNDGKHRSSSLETIDISSLNDMDLENDRRLR